MPFLKKKIDPYEKWFKEEDPWKKAFLLPLPIIAVIILLGYLVSAWHWYNPKVVGKVNQTQVEVRRYAHNKLSYLRAENNFLLFLNDKIEVGIGSKLRFTLGKGTEIVADEETELELLNFDRFYLESGWLWVQADSEIIIELPEGSLRAADADFVIEQDDEKLEVSVVRKLVQLEINGKQINIPAKHKSVAYKGKHPSEPVAALRVDLKRTQFAQQNTGRDIDPALLNRGSVFAGRLLDRRSNLPVQGTVFLVPIDGSTGTQDESDEDGYYIITDIDPGKYDLAVRARGYITQKNLKITFPDEPAIIQRYFILERGDYIRISIVDTYKRVVESPSPRLQLVNSATGKVVFNPPIWVESDQSISLENLTPGNYDISIVVEGYAATTIKNIPVNSERVITLLPAGSISGRILKASDKTPVRKFWIKTTKYIPASNTPYVYDKEWKELVSTEGEFVLDNLNPGSYTLCAVNPDLTPVTLADIPVKAANTTSDIRFLLTDGGTITGFILEKNSDRPIAGADIAIYQYDMIELDRLSRQNNYAATSSKDGSFKIGNVSAGKVRFVVSHSNFVDKKTGFYSVSSGKATSIKLYLARGSALRGKVLDQKGIPLKDHLVSLLDSANNGIVTYTDENGRYGFDNLSAGKYTLRVGTTGSALKQLDRPVQVGSEEDLVIDMKY